MTTLVPTSSQQNQQQGTTITPSTGVESYEDMFKEITRKLYGEESAHGIYPINNSQVAQLAQTPSAPPEGERSFTTLVSDRNLAQLEYEGVIQTDGSSNFKSEDHLSTAFGLAALMHNGFPPPAVFPVSTNNSTKQVGQTNGDDRQWSQQQSQPQQEDQQIWNSNKNTYTQKLFKIKTKQEPQTSEIIINTSSGAISNVKSEIQQVQKRYSCTVCPYSTDRRDLFTRHENIHKEEKPFHCYACLKQFNRADHVKKHFLRMHREMEYDINKTRRYPPSSKQIVNSNNSSSTSNNTNNNSNNNKGSNNQNSSNNNNNNTFFYNQQPTTVETQSTTATTINIPTFSQHQITSITNNSNNTHNNSTSQQQQQQQQHHHSIEQAIQQNSTNNQQNNINNQATSINIKQEKSMQGKSQKIKGEKRFMCCYCPWSGADNWGLKRHLNTHTKPFVCLLCDYKAARSERLTTHILKVHNKKACNKCSFFADDQAQLAQHQIDSHQNEARVNPRVNNPTSNNNNTNNNNNNNTNNSNNNPTQTIVTNQSINQPTSSNLINPVAANISASTGNVLRTLTNTLVPNIHTTSSNHVFGTLNSSLSNGVSTIYTTSNVNTNIVDQINHHLATTNNWRTINTNPTSVSLSNINTISNNTNSNNNNNNNANNNPVIRSQQQQQQQQQTSNTLLTFTNPMGTHSSNTKRKSGAERLFAYFEADDSDDLELDYARQLQMQALSRNTASVAQDFPNAGGDIKPTTITNKQHQKGVITVKSCKDINDLINRDICGAIGQQQQQNYQQQQQKKQIKNKAMSPIDHSPPASDNNNYSIKRRRKSSSSNDKENVNELLTKQLTFLKQQHMVFLENLNASIMSDGERLKAITEINEIFEGMYRSSLTIISSIENDKFHKLQPKIKQEPMMIYEDDYDENEDAQNYSLPAFLKNNKEITIIMDPKNNNNNNNSRDAAIKSESDDAINSCNESRKNRKQLKPKKIEKEIDNIDVVCDSKKQQQQEPNERKSENVNASIKNRNNASFTSIATASNINNLRDKHMLKLVTKKRCCYICRNKSIDANSYNTKESLLLHNLWRHSPKVLECHRCQTKFNRIYKLKLHKTLKRH